MSDFPTTPTETQSPGDSMRPARAVAERNTPSLPDVIRDIRKDESWANNKPIDTRMWDATGNADRKHTGVSERLRESDYQTRADGRVSFAEADPLKPKIELRDKSYGREAKDRGNLVLNPDIYRKAVANPGTNREAVAQGSDGKPEIVRVIDYREIVTQGEAERAVRHIIVLPPEVARAELRALLELAKSQEARKSAAAAEQIRGSIERDGQGPVPANDKFSRIPASPDLEPLSNPVIVIERPGAKMEATLPAQDVMKAARERAAKGRPERREAPGTVVEVRRGSDVEMRAGTGRHVLRFGSVAEVPEEGVTKVQIIESPTPPPGHRFLSGDAVDIVFDGRANVVDVVSQTLNNDVVVRGFRANSLEKTEVTLPPGSGVTNPPLSEQIDLGDPNLTVDVVCAPDRSVVYHLKVKGISPGVSRSFSIS